MKTNPIKLHIRFTTLLFTHFFLILFARNASTQALDTNYISGSIFLKLKDTSSVELAPYTFSIASLNTIFTKYRVDVSGIRKPFPDASLSISLAHTYRVHFGDSANVNSLINDLQQLSFVDYAEREPKIKISFNPNDYDAQLLWHLAKINAPMGWDITTGSSNIVIAIVDNAVRITHEDLAANIWVNPGEIAGNLLDDDLNGFPDDINGYDVADLDNNPNPPPGTTDQSDFIHGTGCSGIASAVTDNGVGISAIGFRTKIMAVKCSPNASDGSAITNAYDGVYYATSAKADIICMSWGSDGTSLTGQAIMDLATSSGIILIAAAGNAGLNSQFYPAAYGPVVAVGATSPQDQKSGYSNYGSWIDVMAPGDGIHTTLGGSDNSYGGMWGTSMAAPMVAGLAALVLSMDTSLTPVQLEAAIENGCDNIDAMNAGYLGMIGAGRINCFNTLSIFGTGIKENHFDENSSIQIFPNPAKDFVNLRCEKEIASIALIDLSGKRRSFIQENQNVEMVTLNINDVPAGIYFIEVRTRDEFIYYGRITVIL